MPYCGDVEDVVARISAITEAMILVAAVWDVALRFVWTPTGIKPKTAIKQNAAIPIARVNSTSENAAVDRFFTACRFYTAAKAGDLDCRDITAVGER